MNVKLVKKFRSEVRDYIESDKKAIVGRAIISELQAGSFWTRLKFCVQVLLKIDLRRKQHA